MSPPDHPGWGPGRIVCHVQDTVTPACRRAAAARGISARAVGAAQSCAMALTSAVADGPTRLVVKGCSGAHAGGEDEGLSLIHISEPTRLALI
eukprot:4296960-Alexandrium_andersonii.AAC.1